VFTVLLQMVLNLEAHLMEGVDEDVMMAADLVCHKLFFDWFIT
jgi:hypothetical protein